MKIKIYIYGTGKTAKQYYANLDKTKYEVLGFLDSFKCSCVGGAISVINIHDFCAMPEWRDASIKIHVASIYFEIVELLLQLGLSPERIVLCHFDLYAAYQQWRSKHSQAEVYCQFPIVSMAALNYCESIEGLQVGNAVFSRDYCRYTTLQLLVKEIERRNVNGNIAELGVFRGAFSSLMNQLLPSRRLYLFDTFEGFPEESIAAELELAGCHDAEFYNKRFSDTSVKKVMQVMPHPEQCVVMQGTFPHVLPNVEEEYVMVSIDCDLCQVALDGLRYFYPRLVPGGYIMLHDYNSITYHGIKHAVEIYEQETGHCLPKVPITDEGGSLILTK